MDQNVPRLKGMPRNLPRPRAPRLSVALTALMAAGLVVVATATPAEPASPASAVSTATTLVETPRYSGTGWRAWTSNGIYSINPEPYVIVFATTTARSKMTPYLTGPAAQITAVTGVKVTVSTTIDTTASTSCPARHRIVIHYSYRPIGTAGMSQARACHSKADGSAWGGHVLMNSEHWLAGSKYNDLYRKNFVSHELGHIFGLAHPNYDRDRDGRVENYECVKNSAGWTPVMCSPNGGIRTTTSAGKYTTEFDVPGLKQMARNWYLRQAAL